MSHEQTQIFYQTSRQLFKLQQSDSFTSPLIKYNNQLKLRPSADYFSTVM